MNAPKKIIKKVREALVLDDAQRAEWVRCYETTGKLPQINIPCNKCSMGITAGHDNLRSKVKKYNGIANLLATFVCKDCKEVSEPRVAKIKPKIDRPAKARKESVERDHNGKFVIPQVNLYRDNPVYSIIDIAKNQQLTQEFTNGTCMQPHVYLNNDNTCDECPLYDNCGCAMKNLSRSMRRKLETTFGE